ncbi:DUF2255 family protein [Isoptericola sp. NPDC056605]|uniref:DUF2255 family protein n=1 Tax=Isoptericola sp. NPDC056605 TaxID=3345876 RepID=UPI00369E22C4
MTDWNPADLAAIDGDGELRVAAHRPDGTLRTPRIVWHVVVDGALYLRSVRGVEGAWYRGVQRTGTGEIDAGGVRAEVSSPATTPTTTRSTPPTTPSTATARPCGRSPARPRARPPCAWNRADLSRTLGRTARVRRSAAGPTIGRGIGGGP